MLTKDRRKATISEAGSSRDALARPVGGYAIVAWRGAALAARRHVRRATRAPVTKYAREHSKHPFYRMSPPPLALDRVPQLADSASLSRSLRPCSAARFAES